MSKTKQQKQSTLEDIKSKIDSAKSIVFTDYKGLKMKDLQNLRKKLKEKGGSFEITKSTLARIAFGKKNDFSQIIDKYALAIAYGLNDEISVPKEIKNFSKKNENLKILGGFYEGNFLTKGELEKLADISSKEELLVKLLMTLNSPIVELVRNLGGQASRLVRVLRVISEKG